MWMLLLLYSVYFTVISAHELCPEGCECQAKIIKCVGRKLLHIPKWLPKNVTNLDLSGNKLSTIKNNTFLEFSNLVELNLSDNEFTDTENLGKLPKSLQVLCLKGNKLKSLNGNWKQFTKLDFSQNTIETIGNGTFAHNVNLRNLILSNNKIKRISSSAFKNLSRLKILKLDGNNLTRLPELECPILTSLDLSNNNLSSINSIALQMVPSVEILKLSNNKIKILKTGAFSNLKLRHLYLNGNSLKSVTSLWMFGMESLEYLYLENNKIVNISASSWRAHCCNNLKYINLANNNLKQILFADKKCDAGNFKHLISLNTLNLSSNEIFDISDGAFKDLKRLKNLDLSNNEMSIVKKTTFQELPSLERLDMRNNPIVEVTKDAFASLVKLKDLWMSSDVLYCSCKLRWFSKWLKTKTFSRSIGFTCNQPKKLQGIEFTKIPVKDLVCDSSRPEIIHHPQSRNATKGDEVTLKCIIKNGSIQGIRVLWQKNKNNVNMTQSKVKVFTQQTDDKFFFYISTLCLSHVTNEKDGGAYQCIVLAAKERIPSRVSRLRVYDPPKFTSTPSDLVSNVGDDVYFNCSASGDPLPEISFTLPAHSTVKERRIGVEGNTFSVRNISRGDVGLYRCFAKSVAGVINTTFTLNVRGKPVAAHEMLDKMVLLNDAAVFICAASGWPLPKYTWFKNGKMLDLTSANLQFHKETNSQHLIILHAGYLDAGRYVCRVSNALGSFELSSQLTVVEKLLKQPDSSDDENVTHNTLIGTVIFTAASTMVVTTLIFVAVIHAITRRGCSCLTVNKTSDRVTLDSYTTVDRDNHEYVHMAKNLSNESPRSSSTFVTSSDSRAQSDLQTSSSESGSSKDHRGGSYDGRHSSGVCSMNTSTSSLASTSNHRNTFPFSNAKTYLHQETGEESYDVNRVICNDIISTLGNPTPRASLQLKTNEQYNHGRRKHRSSRDKSSRSRERHLNKRRKVTEQERLHGDEQLEQTSATDEYRTESEGTVL